MLFDKLCYAVVLLIHHGAGAAVIQFNVSEDTAPNLKLTHGKLLPIFNTINQACEQETRVAYAEVSDGLLAINGDNNMRVSEHVACYMYCFTLRLGLINEKHALNMDLLNTGVNIYGATLKHYSRLRAIMSVMIACYLEMKTPTRLQHCDLFRAILKCVAMYEKQYGPYTVRP